MRCRCRRLLQRWLRWSLDGVGLRPESRSCMSFVLAIPAISPASVLLRMGKGVHLRPDVGLRDTSRLCRFKRKRRDEQLFILQLLIPGRRDHHGSVEFPYCTLPGPHARIILLLLVNLLPMLCGFCTIIYTIPCYLSCRCDTRSPSRVTQHSRRASEQEENTTGKAVWKAGRGGTY